MTIPPGVAKNATAFTPTTTQPEPAHHAEAGRHDRVSIGKDGQPIRALAFSGGLFDAAMQLGTVHALLVTCATPPDVVVGISTGAINAVAAAEVLKAGEGIADEAQAVEARVSRFRQIFEAYRQSPEEVLAPFFPDIYQIEAEAALKPTDLPIYQKEERADRYRAAQSRAGLIKLTNDFLRLNISVGSIARVVRVALGWVAARELPSKPKRILARSLAGVRLWKVLVSNLFSLAPVGARLIRIASYPTAKRFADWLRQSATLYRFIDRVPNLDTVSVISSIADRVERHASAPQTDKPFGVDAGHVIFRSWLRQGTTKSLWWLLGFALVFVAVVVLPVMIVAIVAAIVYQGLGPIAHFVQNTAVWNWVSTAARSAVHRMSAPVRTPELTRLIESFRPISSYVASVVSTLASNIASAVEAVHRQLDAWISIDAPIHALNPATLSIPRNLLWVGGVIVFGWFAKDLVSTDAVLRYYGILDGVLDPYPLQSWLVRLFDQSYFGESQLDDIVARAFGKKEKAGEPRAASDRPKQLDAYARGDQKIHVGPMAADVRTGKLTVLSGDTPVIDALLAATAVPPFFQAQRIPRERGENDEKWYIDGSVVANEPTAALVSHLTPLVNERSTELLIYAASSLPLSATELGPEDGVDEYAGLVDSSRRALSLESFRDATLDRRMTDLVSRAMPAGGAVWTPTGSATRFVRSSVHPVELDRGTSLNTRLLGATGVTERRRMIAESVADGCRSSIEVLLHQSLVGSGKEFVSCKTVINARVGNDRLLPGSKDAPGPGLPEVCQACAIRNAGRNTVVVEQSLRVPSERRALPIWPTIWDAQQTAEKKQTTAPSVRASTERMRAEPDHDPLGAASTWPIDRTASDATSDAKTVRRGEERATVSLLFSGGVFRGVYLAGVINALNEVGVQPDIIAGSSIGSITAAMAARLFCESDPVKRAARIARVAATYLAVDRLVLTDRFSDFIRNFTLRASATRFSVRDLDTTFRAFDRERTGQFGMDARRVLAGLERLVYLSPFEARDLAQSSRTRRYDRVLRLLGEYAQEWLERGGVGLEILGAEPLERLIRYHVLDGSPIDDVNAATAFTKALQRNGIQFVATATNLSRGKLETLCVPPPPDSPDQSVRLVQALLASSAFPAIFRPRWTWEVIPETSEVEQLIDGGVMDNLPLDAVTRFLNNARGSNRLAVRPSDGKVPHLLFTASLEVQRPELTPEATRYVAGRWLEAYRRARALSYNNKIDNYTKTQQDLRTIWNGSSEQRGRYQPLDLEIVAVKPNWLCGTFAFHPMLGFRRVTQAESIAHGCKTTLERLYELGNENSSWTNGWGLEICGEWKEEPRDVPEESGECWYRNGKGCKCPFSAKALETSVPELSDTTKHQIAQIHVRCREGSTHTRPERNQLLREAEAVE